MAVVCKFRKGEVPPDGWWTAVTAALAAISVMFFGLSLRVSHEDSGSFYLELSAVSPTGGRLQVYFDRGRGLSESDSIAVQLSPHSDPEMYKLPLSSGEYHGFRFDPLDRPGTVMLLTPPRVVHAEGKVRRVVPYSQFQPRQQIESVANEGETLVITIPLGVNDPQIDVPLEPPLLITAVDPHTHSGFAFLTVSVGSLLALAVLSYARNRGPADTPLLRKLCFFSLNPPLAITLAVCGILLLSRKPDAVANPQFWAEDSIEFYKRTFVSGTPELFAAYAGYVHAIPRLVAWLSLQLDPLWAPTVFTVCVFLLTLYVAALTQSVRSPFRVGIASALAIVLVPDAFEVLLVLTNVQWFLAVALGLILVSADAETTRQKAHDWLAALLFGLTGPFSMFYAPLFLARAFQRRTKQSALLFGMISIAAVIQAFTFFNNPIVRLPGSVAYETILAVPGGRIGASLLCGVFFDRDFSLWSASILGVVTCTGIILLGAFRGPYRGERSWIAITCILLLGSALLRARFHLPELCEPGYGSRYFVPVQSFILLLTLAATRFAMPTWKRIAAALSVWCISINAPRWKESALEDLHWPEYALRIREGHAVSVRVHPDPWVMDLPARTGNP